MNNKSPETDTFLVVKKQQVLKFSDLAALVSLAQRWTKRS